MFNVYVYLEGSGYKVRIIPYIHCIIYIYKPFGVITCDKQIKSRVFLVAHGTRKSEKNASNPPFFKALGGISGSRKTHANEF